MKIGIVVLNWNSPDDTLKCIKSILNQSISVQKIYLVDNNSSDNSVKIFEDKFKNNPFIQIIKNDQNLGFSGGVNAGFRAGIDDNLDVLGTINPDAILDKNWIKETSLLFNNPKNGIVGGILINPRNDKIDSFGEGMSIWGLSFPMDRGKSLNEINQEQRASFGVTGGAVLYRVAALKESGIYDEKFFLYYEDSDLSYRLRLKGWSAECTKKAIAYHKTSSTTSKISGLITLSAFKNMPLLVYKNTPKELLHKVLPRFWVVYMIFWINSIFKGSFIHATKGLMQSIALIPHALKNRQGDYDLLNITNSMTMELPENEIKLRKLFYRK